MEEQPYKTVSEIHELFNELKERYQEWRLRTRLRDAVSLDESFPDKPLPDQSGLDQSIQADVSALSDIEFKMLDPHAPSDTLPLQNFAEVKLDWLATQCLPEVFAQGQRCCLAKRVTRVHAHGQRMTGTTHEQRFEDQEIVLQEGKLIATCTCEQISTLPGSAQGTKRATQEPGINLDSGRTLHCHHVVAVILAYLQPLTAPDSNHMARPPQAREPDSLVCPVTRQKLEPKQAFYQCRQCGICYSVEGWDFLRKTDKGRCCGCESRKTVQHIAPTF